MDLLHAAMRWTYEVAATWYAAAIIGGVLILVVERCASRTEPSDGDVKRAAAWYHRHYGDRALTVIGDHILAAGFAPDARYRRFLRRVAAQLLADATGGGSAR